MFGIGLMILLAQSAFAEELGQANITPRTKMEEIRSNPSIVGAGIYTYCWIRTVCWTGCTGTRSRWSRLSNHWTAQDAADGLNYLIRTYNAGQRVTFPLYTAEEIAQGYQPGRCGTVLSAGRRGAGKPEICAGDRR